MSEPSPPFSNGQSVTLECRGVTVEAVIMLASQNGKSLMVAFEGLLIGYAGMMPLLVDDHGQYRDLIQGIVVSVNLKG